MVVGGRVGIMFVLEATRDCWTHPFPNDVLFCCLCVHDIYTDVLLCMDTTFGRGLTKLLTKLCGGSMKA